MNFAFFFGIQKLFNYFGLHVTRRNPGVAIDDCWNEQLRLIGNDVKTIIEVGAADGRDSLKYAQSCHGAIVLAFEPLPESFKRLKEKAAKNHRIRPYNFAISDHIGNANFKVMALEDASSLLNSNSTGSTFDKYIQQVSEIEVNLTTLDRFAKSEKLDRIDLLKMDVQGAELLVLDGAKELLGRKAIQVIFTEMSFMRLYKGGASSHQIIERLESFGYEIHGIYNMQHNQNGQLAWADAIFVQQAPI